jgi:hypothetical protein
MTDEMFEDPTKDFVFMAKTQYPNFAEAVKKEREFERKARETKFKDKEVKSQIVLAMHSSVSEVKNSASLLAIAMVMYNNMIDDRFK